MAISWLLLSLRADSAQDYIFACFFLICTSSLLKIRWLLGTLALTPPLLLVASAAAWNPAMSYVLPRDAEVHLTVAWATGGLMSYVADSYRRCGGRHMHHMSTKLARLWSDACRISRALLCSCMLACLCWT